MPATLEVRVQPRASCNGFGGRLGDALKVRLTAPPVDGAANAALLEFLAGALEVRKADVALVSGHAGRTKVVRFETLTPDTLEARLRVLLGAG